MMIQSSNPITTLPGLESSTASIHGLDGNPAAFTSSLLQQLAMLQDNLPNNAVSNTITNANGLSDFQTNQNSNLANSLGQDMQNFAGLFGKISPSAKKNDQGINLDDTLNALSDVLHYLQSLNADPVVPVQTQIASEVANQPPLENDHSLAMTTGANQNLDPSALATAAGSLQQIQQPLQTQQVVTPQQSTTKEVSSQIPDTSALSVNLEASVMKKTFQTDNSSSKRETNGVLQTDNNKQSPAIDSNAVTMGVMSDQNNASQNNGQEQQRTEQSRSGDISGLTKQSVSSDADNKSFGISTDIANLNQAVSNGKSIQAPPMVKNMAHPEWNTELGQKLIWMHKQEVPSAELRLNPEHLGPITIKVDVDQGQTTVSFIAQHAEVKDAIEAAIPKLREMLGGQQLNLVDVNVSQQQTGQKQSSDFFQAAGGQGQGSKSEQSGQQSNSAGQPSVDLVDEIESGRAIASNGLLSLFA